MQGQVEGMIRKGGKVRMLFVMSDFHGWTAGATWEDIKFGLRNPRSDTSLPIRPGLLAGAFDAFLREAVEDRMEAGVEVDDVGHADGEAVFVVLIELLPRRDGLVHRRWVPAFSVAWIAR